MKVLLSESFQMVLAKKGLKKSDVAHDLSVTVQHFSRLVHNKSGVGFETQRRLKKMFNGFAWDRLFKLEHNEQ